MTSFTYPYAVTRADRFAPGETGFVIEVRDFDAVTQAETSDEVAVRVRTLVETMIEDLIDANAAIPDGSTPRNGEHITSPGLSMALKAALHTAMRNAGMTKSELARVMAKDEKEVRRLLDPRHRSGIASAQAAFDALGVSPRIAA